VKVAGSDITHQEGKRSDLTDVKLAHVELMRAYVNALDEASLVNRVQPWPRRSAGETWKYHWRSAKSEVGFLVRWMTGSHIRRNLKDLADIYLQLEQTFIGDESDPPDPWLRAAREGCLATADRLPSSRLPGAITIVSLAAAVAGILSKLPGWAGPFFLTAAIGAIIGQLVFYPIIASSYRYKRSLFLRDAGLIDRRSPEEQKSAHANNTYALEDGLFKMLHRGKRRENEVDKLTSIIELGLLTYTAIG
jgi:hypothetical protein